METCPKCNGQGKLRHKFWVSGVILHNLILLKANYPLDYLLSSMFVLKIKCPLCDGDGIFDWIKKATKGHVNRKSKKLIGNMDIYFLKAVESWPPNSTTHTWYLCNDNNLYKNLKNILKCSQISYRGIKLNESILKMRVKHLEDLSKKISSFYDTVNSLSKNQITRSRIIKEMSLLGLSEFLPDQFAYPDLDDFAT